MRAVVQRVAWAKVSVDGQVVGEIGPGMMILLGVGQGDDEKDVDYLARKVHGLRIFKDDAGKMNRGLADTGGQALVVSQFTLYGDVKKGRRPSYNRAALPDEADRLYLQFCARLAALGTDVQKGQFQADMKVELLNDGPVTILVDSEKQF